MNDEQFSQRVHEYLKVIQTPPLIRSLEFRAFLTALVERLTEAAAAGECDIEEPYRRPMRAVIWALLDNAPNAEDYQPPAGEDEK